MQKHEKNLLNYNLFIRCAPIFPRRAALRCSVAFFSAPSNHLAALGSSRRTASSSQLAS